MEYRLGVDSPGETAANPAAEDWLPGRMGGREGVTESALKGSSAALPRVNRRDVGAGRGP